MKDQSVQLEPNGDSRITSITIDPPPQDWLALVSEQSRLQTVLFDRPLRDWANETRKELIDGFSREFLIGTGHQVGFWHPGILAKYLAADSFAISCPERTRTLELVVDQDANNPIELWLPMHIKTDSPVEPDLRAITIQLDGEDAPTTAPSSSQESNGRPVALRPAIASRPERNGLPVSDVRPESVSLGLTQIVDALGESQEAADGLADQFARANLKLRDRTFGENRCGRSTVFSTQIESTMLWARIIDEMKSNPERAAATYNKAVAAHPDAGIVSLAISHDRVELPLWVVEESTGDRRRAYADDLHEDGLTIWPRALLMTGFVRLALVDLFIHGTGGQAYDRITETWLRNWLGVELAPIAVVSADVFLDFGIEPADPHDVGEARMRLHHLKYNLDREVASDPAVREKKIAILREIESLQRRSPERKIAYLKLQAFQEGLRKQYHDVLNDAEGLIAERERALAERAILEDRTWAFPLHDPNTLQRLRDRIHSQFVSDHIGSLESVEETESFCLGCCGDL